MVHDRPDSDAADYSAQVLPFRLRGRSGEQPFRGPAAGDPTERDSDEPAGDLAQYEQDDADGANINYRRRMLMNMIAALVVMLLVGAGVWIADTITKMEQEQDCVMQGRQNCAPVEVPALQH